MNLFRVPVLSLFCLLSLVAAPFAAAQTCDDLDRDSDGQSCRAGDCNDNDDTIFPGAPEICDGKDNNCDNVVDNPADRDRDGVNVCQGDCDDNDAQRAPGRMEICDGKDNDCNGGTPDSNITRACYSGPSGTQNVGLCRGGTERCSAPSGWSGTCTGQVLPTTEICDAPDQDCDGNGYNGVTDADRDGSPSCLDCDDNDAQRAPGRTEICDGKDNDCNSGTLDSNFTRSCYGGPPGTQNVGLCRGGTERCNGPSGWAGTCAGQVLPATEICDAADQDCDGNGYNGATDADRDGSPSCLDCADNDPDRFPGNREVCDGKDNDCNAGTLDSSFTRGCYSGPSGTQNVGLCRGGTETCNGGSGWSGTCSGQTTPAAEQCDAVDHDCDGNNFNGFANVDNDPVPACLGDCNDNDPTSYPGANEVCDTRDNDCDGQTDEQNNGQPLRRSCYTGPGGTLNRGLCRAGTELCNGPGWSGTCSGQTLPSTEQCDAVDQDCDGDNFNGFPNADNDPVPACLGDCNDNDPLIYPGRPEVCDGRDNDCDGTIDNNFDQDGDGFTTCAGDCRDNDNQTYPGAPEICNGIDNDCDGPIDEDFPDVDRDGFRPCGPNPDCDDNDPVRFPGNPEVCDSKDNDCDSQTDEQGNGQPLSRSCYTGPGGTNGVGICRGGTVQCLGGNFNGTCTGQVLPRTETCDNTDDDCDTQLDEGFDRDGDGAKSCGPNPDCDDNDPARFPGNAEVCDGRDNDCDGRVDRNSNNTVLTRSCYTGPGGTQGVGLCRAGSQTCSSGSFGACSGQVVPVPEICNDRDDDCNGDVDNDSDGDGDGFKACGTNPDCDDGDRNAYPGATEVCDGKDNDCDGRTDENAQNNPIRRPCYTGPAGTQDVGVCRAGYNQCAGSSGFETVCRTEVVPSAEVCNAQDDDCDGGRDNGFDADGDGVTNCGGDCDDTDPEIKPGALELCNNVDDDCDGDIDGEETQCYTGPVGTATVGLCRPGLAICVNGQPAACGGQQLPVPEVCDDEDNDCDGENDEDFDVDRDGVTTCAGDCDDENPFVRPGLAERCDCDDNDCDEAIDEDGFGGSVCSFGACHDFDADGYTNCDGDCSDSDPKAYPGAPEACGDEIDNDCDTVIDEDVDEDNDGVKTCAGDCDDRFAAIHPGAPEVCDGFDNDCNGEIDEGFDDDGDFATTCAGDCNDNDRNRNPFRREICGNRIDDDCDGVVDDDPDADGDGVSRCDGDCNDFNAAVFPGAPEVCDGHDNECNNRVDEGFEVDQDGFATCFGDCDDGNPAVNPFAPERVDTIDNDCDGRIDEGQEDADGDGFSYLCGDCDDSDPEVSPQTVERCNAKDDDCDGVVDRDPRGTLICEACSDVDQDGVSACAGDCDDREPLAYPGRSEVCDGVDNDCNGTVDLSVGGENLCIARPDSGVGDGAVNGGDGSIGGGDGSVNPAPDAGIDDPDLGQSALDIECGCNSTQTTGHSAAAIVLLGLPLLLRLRRRALLLALALVASGCTEFGYRGGTGADGSRSDRGDDGTDGGPDDDDGSSDRDGSRRDAGDGGGNDGSGGDNDGGPLTEGPCRLSGEDGVHLSYITSRSFSLAIHDVLAETVVEGADAIALDDDAHGLRAFAVRAPLPSGIDPASPLAASAVIDQVLDPMFSRGIPGVIGVASRVDEVLKQSFFHGNYPAARTLRRVRMSNTISLGQLRAGFLSVLSGKALGLLGELPVTEDAPTQEVNFGAYVEVDGTARAANVVITVGDQVRTASVASIINDLTNGTHVGPAAPNLSLECKTSTASGLLVDFVWVVDNSASMQEEQEALAQAADTFFGALQRSRIDYRLGVVTTDGETLRGGSFSSELEDFRTRVRVGINGNGREQGLEFALRAIERARTASAAEERLRPGAVPVVIFYTDEADSLLRPIAEYEQFFGENDVLAFAIVGPRPRGCLAVGRGAARVGEEYIRMSESTGGGAASICSEDLTRPIEEILVAAAGAASTTRLEHEPISGSIEVGFPAALVPRTRNDGFDFDRGSNTILFFGNATPLRGEPLRVTYLRFKPSEL